MNNEMNKLLTFTAVEWTGNQRVFTNRGENGQELPPPERRTARILSWMAWTGEEEWDKGLGLFCPSWSHQTRPKTQHLSRSVAPTGTKGPFGPIVPVEATNRDKCRAFGPSWWLQRDKRPLRSHTAQLAVGPGTKALFDPGPKGSRDKWPGPKAYSIVAKLQFSHVFDSNSTRTIDVVVQARSYGTFGCAKIWVINKA